MILSEVLSHKGCKSTSTSVSPGSNSPRFRPKNARDLGLSVLFEVLLAHSFRRKKTPFLEVWEENQATETFFGPTTRRDAKKSRRELGLNSETNRPTVWQVNASMGRILVGFHFARRFETGMPPAQIRLSSFAPKGLSPCTCKAWRPGENF